jgi:Ca2+-binding EF-hand superfamily protein
MGGCFNAPSRDIDFSFDKALNYKRIYSAREDIAIDKDLYDSLKLKEDEVGAMFKIFNRVDKDKSGTIEVLELFMYLDIERTPFTKRSFAVFDSDHSGTIDFKEFVLSLWNYCTLGKATLILFAFDIYDSDKSGCIDPAEIEKMLKDIYGSEFSSNIHAMSIIKKIEGLGSSPIDIDKFREFSRKHQALMFPAFVMQHNLQKNIIGVNFWEALGQKRVELGHGNYIPIEEFMKVHVDREYRDSVLEGVNNRVMTRVKTVHNRKATNIYDGRVASDGAPEQVIHLIHQTGSLHHRSGESMPLSARRGSKGSLAATSIDSADKTPRRGSKGSIIYPMESGVASDKNQRRGSKDLIPSITDTPLCKRKLTLMRIESGLELSDEVMAKLRDETKNVLKGDSIQLNSSSRKGRRSTYTSLPGLNPGLPMVIEADLIPKDRSTNKINLASSVIPASPSAAKRHSQRRGTFG